MSSLTPTEERRRQFEGQALEYMDSLYRTALRMTHNENDAQDLVQDTYLKAFRFADTFAEGTNLKAWLFKILTNSYINTYRKKAREPRFVDVSDVDEDDFYLYNQLLEYERRTQLPSAEDDVLRHFVDDDVKKALESLPPAYRMVVLLADVEEFSYKEIAQMLNIPLGTVMSRLFRGRRLLERALWEYARATGFRV